MATTVAYTYVGVCAGGGHIALDISVNAGAAKRIIYDVDDVRKSIAATLSELRPEELDQLRLLILKLHFAGTSRTTMKNALQSGPVTVTI